MTRAQPAACNRAVFLRISHQTGEVAGRQGDAKLSFRISASVFGFLLTASNSASCRVIGFSAARFLFRPLSDFYGAVTLEMTLGRELLGRALTMSST
jgi:hypothetical protein